MGRVYNQDCPSCYGHGYRVNRLDPSDCMPCRTPCRTCKGTGRVPRCRCGGEWCYSTYCGAYLCDRCRQHVAYPGGQSFVRCFCGWSLSGRDGRRELEDMGEQIEADY